MGLQGSPWPFGNSSISGPMNREWLEHNLNLAECKRERSISVEN